MKIMQQDDPKYLPKEYVYGVTWIWGEYIKKIISVDLTKIPKFFFELVHFWSIKEVYFFQNANYLNFDLFFRLHIWGILAKLVMRPI